VWLTWGKYLAVHQQAAKDEVGGAWPSKHLIKERDRLKNLFHRGSETVESVRLMHWETGISPTLGSSRVEVMRRAEKLCITDRNRLGSQEGRLHDPFAHLKGRQGDLLTSGKHLRVRPGEKISLCQAERSRIFRVASGLGRSTHTLQGSRVESNESTLLTPKSVRCKPPSLRKKKKKKTAEPWVKCIEKKKGGRSRSSGGFGSLKP